MIQTTIPAIHVDGFGFMPGNYRQIVRRYTMVNKNNAVVRLISLGAGIQSILVPNKNEDLADVVLGFDDVTGYLKNRYIGRIVEGSVNPFPRITSSNHNKLKTSRCDIDNWESHVSKDNSVVMTWLNQEDDKGSLMVQATYRWSDENQLQLEIRAASTAARAVELNSCCLFNLAGHGTGPNQLHRHVLTANTSRDSLPQLRSPMQLDSKRLFRVPGGNAFDHHLRLSSDAGSWSYKFHARILHPPSNRSLEVYSDHPSLRLYTGNYLPNPHKINPPDLEDHNYNPHEIFQEERGIEGKDGMLYTRFGCFSLMPQGLSNILHADDESFNILYPGKIYVHNLTYDFGMTIY